MTLYCGFDPSAPSLTAGHLLQMVTLSRFQKAGHRVIAVAGGGTGLIGDPSGRDTERPLLSTDEIASNVDAIEDQLKRFIELDGENGMLLDNSGWLSDLSYIDVLRDAGKHFSVNAMVSREAIKARLDRREQGITYTEFSYVILQAFDFLHLFDHYDCKLQIGGNDQWGNITAGVELVRKARGENAYALTSPLILVGGKKMSKSEGTAIWLDPELSSPYSFYQYWINASDDQVGDLLRYFTWLSLDEIDQLVSETQSSPGERAAHKRLAWEMTASVHGSPAAEAAKKASEALFTGELASLDEESFVAAVSDAPRTTISRDRFEEATISELMEEVGLSPSRSAARRDIDSGGAYMNDERVSDADLGVSRKPLLHGRYLLLRKGKKNYHLVEVAPD